MASKKAITLARQQAHRALASQRQQRIERDRANEADLAGYLLLEQQIGDAERNYRDTIASLQRQQGDRLQHWHARGEKLSTIAELTETPTAELSRLIRLASQPPSAAINQTGQQGDQHSPRFP